MAVSETDCSFSTGYEINQSINIYQRMNVRKIPNHYLCVRFLFSYVQKKWDKWFPKTYSIPKGAWHPYYNLLNVNQGPNSQNLTVYCRTFHFGNIRFQLKLRKHAGSKRLNKKSKFLYSPVSPNFCARRSVMMILNLSESLAKPLVMAKLNMTYLSSLKTEQNFINRAKLLSSYLPVSVSAKIKKTCRQ